MGGTVADAAVAPVGVIGSTSAGSGSGLNGLDVTDRFGDREAGTAAASDAAGRGRQGGGVGRMRSDDGQTGTAQTRGNANRIVAVVAAREDGAVILLAKRIHARRTAARRRRRRIASRRRQTGHATQRPDGRSGFLRTKTCNRVIQHSHMQFNSKEIAHSLLKTELNLKKI